MGSWEWFMTAGLTKFPQRRGDPLGFRNMADYFADLLAPGLSNRTTDARWISLLCWSIAVCGDRLQGAEDYYDWLLPLELFWVARTKALAEGSLSGRQLPGIDAIRRQGSVKRLEPWFGMKPDQRKRYRFIGPYGAYRTILMNMRDIVTNDGWYLGGEGKKLASWVQSVLEITENGSFPCVNETVNGRLSGTPYWQRRWPCWNAPADAERAVALLPTNQGTKVIKLEDPERAILRLALFGPQNGEYAAKRRTVANALMDITADTHLGLCKELAHKLCPQYPDLKFLPTFFALADAAVEVLNQVNQLVKDAMAESPAGVPLDALVQDHQAELLPLLKTLRSAARVWVQGKCNLSNDLVKPVNVLAESVQAKKPGASTLLTLLHHHDHFGQGVHWLKVTRDSKVVPAGIVRNNAIRHYRFRLFALSRLAAQCGVIRSIPAVLMDKRERESQQSDEGLADA